MRLNGVEAVRRTSSINSNSHENEWQFTSDVPKWLTLILDRNRDLPFADAYCEGQSPNSPKRRDLTIEDSNGRIVLTGEVKLPGKKDAATPYNSDVVKGARGKARRAEASFFFTWKVNPSSKRNTESAGLYST